MRHSKLNALIFGFLTLIFLAGLYVYHINSSSLLKEHVANGVKLQVQDLGYELSRHLYDDSLHLFTAKLDNVANANKIIRSISVADARKTVLLSTDRAYIGSVYSKEILDARLASAENIGSGVGFYTFAVYDKKNKTDIYYLVLETKKDFLDEALFDKLKSDFVILFAAAILFFGVGATTMRELIVKPIEKLTEFAKDRNKTPDRFFLTELETLKRSMIEHIGEIEFQKEYNRAVLDSQQDIVIVTDGFSVLNANLAFFEFFGKNGDKAPIDALFFGGEQDGFLSAESLKTGEWAKIAAQNPKATYKLQTHKDGMSTVFSVRVKQMRGEFVVSISDITLLEEYKNNLEKLVKEEFSKRLQSEIKYEYLFNNLDEGVCIHSFDEHQRPSKFLEVNRKMSDIFGYSKEEFFEMTPRELHTHESVAELQGLAIKLLKNEKIDFETKLITKEGRELLCKLHSHLLEYKGEKTVFTSIQDVTENEKLKIEMRQKEKLLVQQSKLSTLGEMLGSISHQWKQPLNAIAMLVETIKYKIEHKKEYEIDEAQLKEDFLSVKKQIKFMAQTIDDFRNFFKPSKEASYFSATKLIQETYAMLEPQYKIDGLTLKAPKADGVNDYVIGYPSEFKQAIMNLLNNTRDALKERSRLKEYKDKIDGIVQVNVYNDKESLFLEYMDKAGGVANEAMEHMFLAYNTTKGEAGTGIGMYMSKRIIEGMGGTIEVKNIDNGALFLIKLPLKKDNVT